MGLKQFLSYFGIACLFLNGFFYTRVTQFLRDQASDTEEVVTPLMQDGTYLSRNFATLGPLTLETPCVSSWLFVVIHRSFLWTHPWHLLGVFLSGFIFRFHSLFILLTPGLDNTRLFMSLTAGAGTIRIILLSSSPNLDHHSRTATKKRLILDHWEETAAGR